MKNMMFIFRGLMKTSFLFVLLFAAQDSFAQSFSPETSFINSSTAVKGDNVLVNASLVNSSQAVENLQTEAQQLNLATPGDDFQQNNNIVKVQYYKYVSQQIEAGNSVFDALSNSGAALNQFLDSKSTIINVTANEVFLDALDLVSN